MSSRPVLYELVDKDGHKRAEASSPEGCAICARLLWPDQSQDDERSGKGWHVQSVGAKFRKKPVVIEAFQWQDERPEVEWPEWFAMAVGTGDVSVQILDKKRFAKIRRMEERR